MCGCGGCMADNSTSHLLDIFPHLKYNCRQPSGVEVARPCSIRSHPYPLLGDGVRSTLTAVYVH